MFFKHKNGLYVLNSSIKWLVLVALLMIIIFCSLSIGRYSVNITQVTKILLVTFMPEHLNTVTADWTKTAQNVVLNIRLPRILIAGLTGAGLAISGAALQGLFRNPLVGPQIIGVSSGAAFGGILAILLFSSMLVTIVFVFIGGAIAILFVFLLAYQRSSPNKAKSRLLKEYFRVLKPGGKLLTHDIMLLKPEDAHEVIERIHQAINVNVQPISKSEWLLLFKGAGFVAVNTDNHAMTLMSPRGMIADERFVGTLKIIIFAI